MEISAKGAETATDKKSFLAEELLDGWLRISTAISNERLVSAMTYNESMVCGLLYRRQLEGGARLTATELCGRLQIAKPQMNAILNRLEQSGMIARFRSGEDRRQVHIELTERGLPIYEEAHREILALPQELINRLGEEKMRSFAGMMREVAQCFQAMLPEGTRMKKAGRKDTGTAVFRSEAEEDV